MPQLITSLTLSGKGDVRFVDRNSIACSDGITDVVIQGNSARVQLGAPLATQNPPPIVVLTGSSPAPRFFTEGKKIIHLQGWDTSLPIFLNQKDVTDPLRIAVSSKPPRPTPVSIGNITASCVSFGAGPSFFSDDCGVYIEGWDGSAFVFVNERDVTLDLQAFFSGKNPPVHQKTSHSTQHVFQFDLALASLVVTGDVSVTIGHPTIGIDDPFEVINCSTGNVSIADFAIHRFTGIVRGSGSIVAINPSGAYCICNHLDLETFPGSEGNITHFRANLDLRVRHHGSGKVAIARLRTCVPMGIVTDGFGKLKVKKRDPNF